MQKKTAVKLFIFIILFGIIILGFILVNQYLSRVPNNPSGTVGNLAGNLYNKGYFCEDEGVVYFSNPYDNGSLYSMNPDETKMKKLESSSVSYINAAGKYIYYYNGRGSGAGGLGSIIGFSGYFRLPKSKNTNPVCLHKTDGAAMVLINNDLYYQTYDNENSFSLYKTSIDGKEQKKISDDQINPVNAANGFFYYNNTTTDYHLYCWDTVTDTSVAIFDTDVYQPIIDGDIVYFINIHEDYKLCRYHMSDGTIDTLTDDRVDLYNYANGLIYYQTSGEQIALKFMNADGTNQTVLEEGAFCDINITSQYVYFHELNNLTPMFKAPIGSTSITSFDTAKDAALKNIK